MEKSNPGRPHPNLYTLTKYNVGNVENNTRIFKLCNKGKHIPAKEKCFIFKGNHNL